MKKVFVWDDTPFPLTINRWTSATPWLLSSSLISQSDIPIKSLHLMTHMEEFRDFEWSVHETVRFQSSLLEPCCCIQQEKNHLSASWCPWGFRILPANPFALQKGAAYSMFSLHFLISTLKHQLTNTKTRGQESIVMKFSWFESVSESSRFQFRVFFFIVCLKA